jgi:hypothetical protein
MSEFKVDLKPEDVNKAIVDAVLKSTLGKTVTDAIEANVKKLVGSTYNNPIDQEINRVIVEVVRVQVLLKQEQIRNIIAERITDKMINDAVEKFSKFLENKY